MDVIIETDIGRDPDDFMALCWLLSAGVKPRAVLVSPGDPDQVAITKFLLHELDCAAPVGVSRQGPVKCSSNEFHYDLLKRQGWPLKMQADGSGVEIIRDVLQRDPATPCFACGPMDSIGAFLHQGGFIHEMTIQGGFVPYSCYQPKLVLSKFDHQESVPSFNLNANRRATRLVLAAPGINRRLVGKNVCHSVEYTKAIHDLLFSFPLPNKAMSLLRYAMSVYLECHDSKIFHDPVAAVCHVHPEVGTWMRARPCKIHGKWSCHPNPDGDLVLVELDHEAFWQHIATGK